MVGMFLIIGVSLYIAVSIGCDYFSAAANRKPIFASVEGFAGDGGSVYYLGMGYEVHDFRPRIGGGAVEFLWGWSLFGGSSAMFPVLSQCVTMGVSYALSRFLRGRRRRFKMVWYVLTGTIFFVYFFIPLSEAEPIVKYVIRYLLCSTLFSLLHSLYTKAIQADGEQASLP